MKTRATLIALALSSTMMAGAHADPRHDNRRCNDCGKVQSVRVVQQDGKGGAGGVVLGGVAGGLLGNQVGSGGGRTLATVAGAVGGAYAGKHIEGKMNKVQVWKVNVRFENGRTGTYNFEHDPHMSRGDSVRKQGGSIRRS